MAAAEGPHAWRADLSYITPTDDLIAPSGAQAARIKELIQGIANTTLFEEGLRTLSPELPQNIFSDLRIEEEKILIKTGSVYTDILTLTNEQLQEALPAEVAAIKATANEILGLLTRAPERAHPPVGALFQPEPPPGPANAELLRIIEEQAARIGALHTQIDERDFTIEDLHTQIGEKDALNNALREQIAEKDALIDHLQGRINTIRTFLNTPEHADPIEHARLAIEGLRQSNQAMATDLATMFTRNDELTTEQEHLRGQLRLANREIENRDSEIERLTQENRALRHDLDAIRHELDDAKRELYDANTTIERLRESQNTQRERLELEMERTRDLRKQISTLEEKIRSKESTIQQLEKKLKEEIKHKNDLLEKNATLQSQFDRITVMAMQQQQELTDILWLLPDYAGNPLERVQSLKEAYIAALGDFSHAKEQLRQAEIKLMPIEQALREKQAALEKLRGSETQRHVLEQQYTELCDKYSRDSQAFLATNESLRQTIARLQEELDRAIIERDQARSQLTPSPSSLQENDE